jgi:phospholipase/carboxylesterase
MPPLALSMESEGLVLNLVHRVRMPATSTPARLPAVMLLHGWTGDEMAMRIFQQAVPAGAMAISPRGVVTAEGGFGWVDRQGGDLSYAGGVAALREFVRRLPEVYPVDPARVVMVGFSQGGAIGLSLAITDPERVAAVAVLAGYLPDWARAQITPASLAGRPMFIGHGTLDTTVPLARAAVMREALEAAGADVTYHEYPTGHKVNRQGMKDLKQWLGGHV